VLFKREQVRRALSLLPRIRPRMGVMEFLEIAREVDAFAALNHSKSKRVFAADVEQHLRGMGVLVPVTTHSPATASGWNSTVAEATESMSSITRRPPETG
jgi:hypothetical protein